MNVPSISTIGFSTLIFSKAMVRGKAMTATATRNQKKTEIVTKSVKKNPQKIRRKEAGEAELHKTRRRRETKKKCGQRNGTKARVLCRKFSSHRHRRAPRTYLPSKQIHSLTHSLTSSGKVTNGVGFN